MSLIVEMIQAVPPLRWLATPAGLAVFVALLGLVMSGLVGRMVLSVEALVNRPARGREKDRRGAIAAERRV